MLMKDRKIRVGIVGVAKLQIIILKPLMSLKMFRVGKLCDTQLEVLNQPKQNSMLKRIAISIR